MLELLACCDLGWILIMSSFYFYLFLYLLNFVGSSFSSMNCVFCCRVFSLLSLNLFLQGRCWVV